MRLTGRVRDRMAHTRLRKDARQRKIRALNQEPPPGIGCGTADHFDRTGKGHDGFTPWGNPGA